MSQPSTTRSVSARTALVLAIVIAVLAGAVGAMASHFPDVDNSHPFHDEIAAIAGAGVTTGFGDGTFRPASNVTRQAMAAFMERGFGRVAHDEDNTTLQAGDNERIATVNMDAGATDSGNGFVVVTGHVAANTASEGNCPCDLRVTLNDAGTGSTIHERIHVNLPGTADEGGWSRVDASAQQVYPLSADASGEYVLEVWVNDSDASDVHVRGELTAVYVPFGPDGDNTLTYGDS